MPGERVGTVAIRFRGADVKPGSADKRLEDLHKGIAQMYLSMKANNGVVLQDIMRSHGFLSKIHMNCQISECSGDKF